LKTPFRSKRKPGGPADGIFEPNMTPLIDVSLVLVVILMVATPLAFQSGIAINAAARSGRTAAKNREVRVELTVSADGTVTVNRDRVPRAQLASRLGPLLASSQSHTVIVRCDDTVAHGDFVSVLDEARALGATHVAVVGS
jgi:biopolymer transport protein ExbD